MSPSLIGTSASSMCTSMTVAAAELPTPATVCLPNTVRKRHGQQDIRISEPHAMFGNEATTVTPVLQRGDQRLPPLGHAPIL